MMKARLISRGSRRDERDVLAQGTAHAGSSLLYALAGIIILSMVSVGVVNISSRSAFTELSESKGNRSKLLAFSGLNYVIGQQMVARDVDGLSYEDFLSRIQGISTLNLSNGNVINLTVTNNPSAGYGSYTCSVVGNDNTTPDVPSYYKLDSSGLASSCFGHYYCDRPDKNQLAMKSGFNDLKSIENPGDVVKIKSYVATGGTHKYWASFNNIGDSSHRVTVGGCYVGFYVANITKSTSDVLKAVYDQYKKLIYDVQVKMGWYNGFDYAVSGVTVRWNNNGLFLSFMRYNNATSCFGSYADYIVNDIKPNPGVALNDHVLVVLWEKNGNAYRWLAYADLGKPSSKSSTRNKENDPKVLGVQSSVDGFINDDASLIIRIENINYNGSPANKIKAFYADASEYYNPRSSDAVATNINRYRYPPEWVDASLFPMWPSNYLDKLTNSNVTAYWDGKDSAYDYFTLLSEQPTSPANSVEFVLNSAATDVELLNDKCSIVTTAQPLESYETSRREIGIHAMGKLNSSDQIVAFDDFAIQVIGAEE